MPTSEEPAVFREALKKFRKRRVELDWEKLDAPSEPRYAALFAELHDLGVTSLALSEEDGGLALDVKSRVDIMRELGAGLPALAYGLISHLTAVSLMRTAGALSTSWLARLTAGARVAFAGNPLDASPETAFEVTAQGAPLLSGTQRLSLAYADLLLVPVKQGDQLKLCLLPVEQTGVRFDGGVSSHGLCLVPVGDLSFADVRLSRGQLFAWPTNGDAAQEADGLLTATLLGMVDEMAERAMRYALERYQGGKMIHEHDAVRQLVGPIELSRRVLEALALATLEGARTGDGGSAAFAVELARESGLDAVQTFGGWGYMEDYRVERYLRDANTLETTWIHAAARKRAIATTRFAELSS
ncbi:MAG: acyl-CoA dehydrogenase [Myxococcaceae bacterium]|nr:acyl-CoA dehydrogenase [Myxococcaceae bacterium]